ncbi:cell division FtsA domain-containing protein [Peribacillus sp. SCS-37]|uniref:cell division FtsA domain-containing protein n=1 Tax=Paraperibacillus esterisolvens TaxID=3115296 RepID=UPI003905F937
MAEKIFALDIGTHSVVGIILEKQNERFQVIEALSKEHSERAMLDGQIHDVLAVSSIILEIKEALEKKHGKLEKVCVAAAGRALKTERASAALNIDGRPLLLPEDILHLELTAVQQAQAQVAVKSDSDNSYQYYCAGYSVLYHRLDGQEIGNLIDQSGMEASVEIIATFLPKVVVESLLAALKRAGLEMQALTLEPIAAIHVLIPQSMRRLNVALVDIGAGTSDIALTEMGTVAAYGMVPIAGDEITEAISDAFLLDFPLAEQTKRRLNEPGAIKVTDILGFETEIFRAEAIKSISPAIHKLADAIAAEIHRLNNSKPPKAVMLVGGGSLTPDLPRILAEKLELPENRIAIRGIEAIANLSFSEGINKGPELVTPIGIAVSSSNSPVQYKSILVNGRTIRLFDMKKLTVGDCILAAGIKLGSLYGESGPSYEISLNGEPLTLPGSPGSPPSITLDGEVCSLQTTVKNNSSLTVEKGSDGKSSSILVKDLLDDIPRKAITINGIHYVVEAVIKLNGRTSSGEEPLKPGDSIICRLPDTISALLEALKLNSLLASLRPFSVKLNNKVFTIGRAAGRIFKNGIKAKPHSLYEDDDVLLIERSGPITVKRLAEELQMILDYAITVSFNGKKIQLKKDITSFYRGDEKLDEEEIIRDGEELRMTERKIEPFIFQDIFNIVEVDMPLHAVRSFLLLKNNEETAFHEKIQSGDELKLLWPSAPAPY